MFITILIPILIIFLFMAFLPLVLNTFSPNELTEMGIYLGDSETTSSLPITEPCNGEIACQLWNAAEQVMA